MNLCQLTYWKNEGLNYTVAEARYLACFIVA